MSREPRPLSERITKTAFLILLSPLILPLVTFAVLLFVLNRVVLYLLVWMVWLPQGKDTLFVYSDSPIWREYMTEQVLPLVKQRAVVLNWSERSEWRKWSLPVRVFRSFGGEYAFNPLVILFRPFRQAKRFRFWAAFKDFKHGRLEPVEQLTNALRTSI